MKLHNCLSFVLELAEVDRLLFFRDILGDAILNEGELQRSASPLLTEQILEWKADVLWFAFVKEPHQRLKLLGIKSIFKNMVGDVTIFNFTKAFKNFTPI